ncbi:MAG TPA: hypothetical protein VF666_05670 [Pyrinomonadaceae bacterium]|jgi:hypothetical protein
MRSKKFRLGPQLFREAARPAFFDQVHVIFGGSGAVGGATALQLISLFEEASSKKPLTTEGSPRVVITARTKQELRQFTSILYRIQQRDHAGQPTALEHIGYRTARGVVVELNTLDIDPDIPELSGFSVAGEAARNEAIQKFLALEQLTLDSPLQDKFKLVESAIRERVGRPFTNFLRRYAAERGLPGDRTRFRSVVVAIPLATVASYKLKDLEVACSYLGIASQSSEMEELKTAYLRAIRDDLAHVADELADDVLAAHTTAVGGMYDEELDGTRTIRLGFAHSALDERLRDKQAFAEQLTKLYAERGIKMLITAAAIGIDSILVRKTPPLNSAIRQQLLAVKAHGHEVLSGSELNKIREMRVYAPVNLDLLDEPHQPVSFSHGRPLVLDYVLKSGENGFFTVANADALYRVMRVTSNSELGLLLARTAALGDDPINSWFVDNICYYTESDNSRQVFDLLNQPQLRTNQVSGLQPKALQDLGSAKHQGELHTLGLLILLHRLQTLNLEALPRNVDLKSFDPKTFFETHSQALSIEHVGGWDVAALSSMLVTLVTANTEAALAPLKHYYQTDPNRQEAIHRILREVMWATRAVPSLGTPILYEAERRRRVIAGYYAAPIDEVLTHRDSFAEHFRRNFGQPVGRNRDAYEKFIEFHIANFGFADIRPIAVLTTARSDAEAVAERVEVFRDESSFINALQRLEPYTYFTTSGLLALLVRLKGLARLAHGLDFGLGSANEFRTHFYHDEDGRPLLVPGIVEAFRMVSEGLEKNTGMERLDGHWGYYIAPSARVEEK